VLHLRTFRQPVPVVMSTKAVMLHWLRDGFSEVRSSLGHWHTRILTSGTDTASEQVGTSAKACTSAGDTFLLIRTGVH
jgi:hypothetical protein